MVVGASFVLVAAILLVVNWIHGEDKVPVLPAGGSLVSAVTGTTDRLTEAEAGGYPSISPNPGRVEPSRAQWEELLPKLEKIVEDAPDDVNARRKLALAYYNLGLYQKAADIYEGLLKMGGDAILRARLGNTLRDMGDLAGAEVAYRRAIAADPSLAPPYLDLAELLWRQGRDSEALAVLDEGIAAVPEQSKEALLAGRGVLSGQEGEAAE